MALSACASGSSPRGPNLDALPEPLPDEPADMVVVPPFAKPALFLGPPRDAYPRRVVVTGPERSGTN